MVFTLHSVINSAGKLSCINNDNSFVSTCFGISACMHPAWTIEEHKLNGTQLSELKSQLINEEVGYKGLWQECLWSQRHFVYTCTSYISDEMTPLVNVVLKGCRAMVISFILLSLFGSTVAVLGIHQDHKTTMATILHPNRKYFKRKNILLYLASCIISVSSVLMVVACIW